MKKIFCILLASLLLITVAVSCTDNKAEGQTTENTSEAVKTSVESTSTQEENPGETTTDDIGTTAVDTTEVGTTEADTTEVGTTEADTAEPEETTAPDESIAVIPNQRYVGKWAYTFENEGRVIEAAGLKLVINAVNSDSVIFSFHKYKGIDLESVAVKKDGKYVFGTDVSPYLDYDHYLPEYWNKGDQITGSIVFFEDKISFTITEINSTENIMFDIKYETGTSPRELPDDAAKVIDDVIGNLEEKGWEKIKRIKTEPDSLKRWNIKIDPYDPEYNTVIYNLFGTHDGVDIVVRIVFNDQTQKWEVVEVFYASSNGILLKDETLKEFIDNTGKTDFILPADDVDLLEYFK